MARSVALSCSIQYSLKMAVLGVEEGLEGVAREFRQPGLVYAYLHV